MDISHLITPYKLGVPALAGSGAPGAFDERAVDCFVPFRHNGKFYATYVGFDGTGYQTALAISDDLVHWRHEDVILKRGANRAWDSVGMAATTLLMENDLYAERTLRKADGKYWMMYHAYPGEGYEAGSAQIGLCYTEDERLLDWTFVGEPVFSPHDGASWEVGGLYKSWLMEHEGTYYMFYNAKNRDDGRWLEQTGMATSKDMLHWTRYDGNPILPVAPGAWDSVFASDPVVLYDGRIGKWVMFYYGLGNLSACDGLAVSDDLYHWEKFPSPILTIGGRGTIDSKYAHKPGILYHDGNLYHFYCACRPSQDGDPTRNFGDEFRCISVARTQPWGASGAVTP
ncbi:MAG: hypothetical protein GX558_04850 [Clostridiales bacterium]|nr:hypothetical protein [Clostridiales bacterium]